MVRIERASPQRKRTLPEGANRKRFAGKEREADVGGPHVRFERPRRRPKAAVVAGVEPRRGREIRGYQEFQGVLPRRWVVDLVVGEHHVDGDTFSGGRRLGRWWGIPVVCCKLRIEARVRRRDALESYWQEMGGRGARTGAN